MGMKTANIVSSTEAAFGKSIAVTWGGKVNYGSQQMRILYDTSINTSI
jgi:hypothetical protein